MLRAMGRRASMIFLCFAACNSPAASGPVKPDAASSSEAAGDAKEAVVRQVPIATKAGAAFEAPLVELERYRDGNVRVSIEVRRTRSVRPWSGSVRYTAEPIDITGPLRGGVIDESDVLGSGFAFDLDGDGATDDRLAAKCDGGSLMLGSTTLEPVMSASAEEATWVYRDPKGGFLGQRLGAAGATAMLYLPCTEALVVLGIGADPFVPLSVTGPLLSVQLFASGDPGAGPKFEFKRTSVDGKPVESEGFEMAVFEPLINEPAWFGGRGLMLMLDPSARAQTIVVDVTGVVDVASISINEANEGFERVRSHLSMRR